MYREFIYVDSTREWWVAEGKIIGTEPIKLLAKLPSQFKRVWPEKFIDYVYKFTPRIIFFNDEENAVVVPAAGRKTKMPM